eukprot:COSAG06_NODE_4730_length_3996_cov_6.916603_1_plen_88_part_00
MGARGGVQQQPINQCDSTAATACRSSSRAATPAAQRCAGLQLSGPPASLTSSERIQQGLPPTETFGAPSGARCCDVLLFGSQIAGSR